MKYSAEFEILRGFIFGVGFVFNNHENVVGIHALRCTINIFSFNTHVKRMCT